MNNNETSKFKKVKKKFQYLLLLKKFKNIIDYKNIKFLSAFLTRYGNIRSRNKTNLSVQDQRSVAKAIRKARALQLIPFTYTVKY
jgi:ribosomal protein S18